MDYKRVILYVAIAFVGMSLWSAWQKDYPIKSKTAATTVASSSVPVSSLQGSNSTTGFKPGSFQSQPSNTAVQPAITKKTIKPLNQAQIASKANLITVKTDLLKVKINLNGGDLVSSQLLAYPQSTKNQNQPISILDSKPMQQYIAQTGITTGNSPLMFSASQKIYTLNKGDKQLKVVLTAKDSGLLVTKTFLFVPGKYAIHVTQKLTNQSNKTWTGSFYNQIARDKPDAKHSIFTRGAISGGAISSPETPYHHLTFKAMREQNVSKVIKNGWVAMQQHYFLSAWIPEKGTTNQYYSNVNGNRYTLGFVSPAVTLAPGQSAKNQSTFYVGPEIESNLKVLAPGLALTINYGWLAPISSLIFIVMNAIHTLVGNWGWSIILVTILIKLLLYYPSSISYKSMAKMRLLTPQIQALKERHQDDRQALSQATMALYKKEKVNPMGGCLPMLVQIPIFFALYYVLIESVQLRHAPFIFWIHDLSVRDPYYILPIIMGASMFLQQRLSPASPDPAQAKMMMFLPLIFTVLFIHFPAGLVLYWVTNNLVSMAQQWYVMKSYDPKAERQKSRQKKRKKRK